MKSRGLQIYRLTVCYFVDYVFDTLRTPFSYMKNNSGNKVDEGFLRVKFFKI